jgi:hypothetical protein
MKKALIIFILLIIAAGAAAYYGWVNVPAGSFGVAHSTLTGTIPYPLESGNFYWFWQKLIPRSFELYLFSREPRNLQFQVDQELPGGALLERFGSFRIEAAVSLRYALDFESALVLMERDMAQNHERALTRRIQSSLEEEISSFVVENLARLAENGGGAGEYLGMFRNELQGAVLRTTDRYQLREAEVTVNFRELPQLGVYRQAVRAYFEYLDTLVQQQQARLRLEAEQQARLAEAESEIERWEMYGRLLEQYPDLLKYFYIEKLADNIRVVLLPENQQTGFPRFLEPEMWETPEEPDRPGEPDRPEPEQPGVQEPAGEEEPPAETQQQDVPPGDVPGRETAEQGVPERELPEQEAPGREAPGTQETAPGEPAPQNGEQEPSAEEPGRERETDEELTWYEKLMFWRYFR